jgi:hypothetical protein
VPNKISVRATQNPSPCQTKSQSLPNKISVPAKQNLSPCQTKSQSVPNKISVRVKQNPSPCQTKSQSLPNKISVRAKQNLSPCQTWHRFHWLSILGIQLSSTLSCLIPEARVLHHEFVILCIQNVMLKKLISNRGRGVTDSM